MISRGCSGAIALGLNPQDICCILTCASSMTRISVKSFLSTAPSSIPSGRKFISSSSSSLFTSPSPASFPFKLHQHTIRSLSSSSEQESLQKQQSVDRTEADNDEGSKAKFVLKNQSRKEKGPWNPAHKLTREQMDRLRSLRRQDPDKYTFEVLMSMFRISFEAVGRILHSRWNTGPSASASSSSSSDKPDSSLIPVDYESALRRRSYGDRRMPNVKLASVIDDTFGGSSSSSSAGGVGGSANSSPIGKRSKQPTAAAAAGEAQIGMSQTGGLMGSKKSDTENEAALKLDEKTVARMRKRVAAAQVGMESKILEAENDRRRKSMGESGNAKRKNNAFRHNPFAEVESKIQSQLKQNPVSSSSSSSSASPSFSSIDDILSDLEANILIASKPAQK